MKHPSKSRRGRKGMSVLIIFNREPYDNTDVTWNGLRLAGQLLEKSQKVRIFLMNDAVDMARDACKPPEGYDQDLGNMLKELISRGSRLRSVAPAWRVVVFTRTSPTSMALRNQPCQPWPIGLLKVIK